MRIDVYSKYKVIQKSRVSVRVGEDEFEEQTFEQTERLEGGELINWVSELMERNNCISIETKGNIIFFSEFNPFSAEDGDMSLTITELKEPDPDKGTSLDKKHNIYISKHNREEFFDKISNLEKQGENISYYFTPDYLEQICFGETDRDDKAYTHIIKLLKKEYKEYSKENNTLPI